VHSEGRICAVRYDASGTITATVQAPY
jgi:hypothetical protein